ncbi:MAG: alpha/beta fold hydrolase [Chromatiales bacterium]|nr:alpha/beta fold hydrolase [Chromatiales bacterium]
MSFPLPEFRPPAWLRNQHLQSTLASSGWRRRRVQQSAAGLLAKSQPEPLDCGDGVRLLALHAPGAGEDHEAPAVILMHGWEGSADSHYMVSAGQLFHAAGWRVIRLNLRDHGNSEHLNPGIFHSCRIEEVYSAVELLARRVAPAPLALAGWSLGGNFALRVAALACARGLPLARVTALCPVLDPGETMAALDSGWFGYRLYFLRKWRRSLERKAAAFPELYQFGDLGRFRQLETMTEHFVTRYAGFPDLRTYLGGYALTGGRLGEIEVPTEVLLAEDDPVIPVSAAARVDWPRAVTVRRTRFGGHCGFLQDWRASSWLDEYVTLASGLRPR